MNLRTPSPALRYGSAIAAVIVAILARQSLDPWVEARLPFAFQYIALAFVAWYGGFGPAILAMIFGALGTWFFILEPRGQFLLSEQQIWSVARYLIDGLAITLLGYALSAIRRRSAALQASEARYRQLVEFSLDAIWIHTDDILVYLNPEATKVFGVADPSQLLGRKVEEIIHPDERARARERRAMMRGTGRRAPLTVMKFMRADGKPVLLEVKASPIEYEGRPSIVAVGRDVTERTQLEEQLHQAQKLEAVGQLTGGIAHDFNNLLTVIVCNLDLLKELPKIPPAAIQSIDLALSAALRGADLTRQLVAFARRQALVPKAFSMNDRVSATVDLLQRSLGEHVEIKLVLEPELWSAMADPSQFESALVNLAINARDAMEQSGRLTIETANMHLDEDYARGNLDVAVGDYVMLCVSDTGSGMTPEVLARAFEPFFTTKAAKGSGLGLSMVYGFARQSKGHVKIYSEPGRGTSIRLYLPRADAPAGAGAARKPDALQSARSNERILVVEDNADVRQTVMRQLRDLGYETIEASSGKEAIAVLKSAERVDLLFSDVVMPGGMDGTQLAEAASQIRPGLKILLTSGFARASIQEGATAAYLKNLLSKPYRKAELAERLRATLDAAE
ncbi:PAS domain S-box protein [Dongia sedimenti]|uniref:histidine kinase n=1 Tax=Dongia sedimenti TaxID=3064282 RepID=A0ABU0YJN3_9PROT|nr:PAS domain S-box protein [Rhodospirillaceae bacterium R-7]